MKIWLHVGHAEQLKRLHARFADPLKNGNSHPLIMQVFPNGMTISIAIERMLAATPNWLVVHSNDNRRTHLAVIRTI